MYKYIVYNINRYNSVVFSSVTTCMSIFISIKYIYILQRQFLCRYTINIHSTEKLMYNIGRYTVTYGRINYKLS